MQLMAKVFLWGHPTARLHAMIHHAVWAGAQLQTSVAIIQLGYLMME